MNMKIRNAAITAATYAATMTWVLWDEHQVPWWGKLCLAIFFFLFTLAAYDMTEKRKGGKP